MVKSPKLLNSVSLFFIAAQLYICLGYSSARSFPSIWSGILLTCCPGALVFLQLCCFPCLCVKRTEISVCKFSCCSPSSFMFFAVVDAHGHHTGVCSALKNLQPHILSFYHMQICCPLEYCQVNGWILPGVWQSWERWKTILLPPLLLKEWPGPSQLPDQEGAL